MRLALALTLALAWPAWGQESGNLARNAADGLDRAAAALSRSQGAQDRVAALTGAVDAYETGLAALRDGLRRLSEGRQAARADLDARQAEIGTLIAALQGMGRDAAPLMLLHPEGPRATARAATVLAQVAPSLQRRADAVRADLDALIAMEAQERLTQEALQTGLATLRDTRAALSEAIAARTDLPDRLSPQMLAEQAAALRALDDQLAALPDAGRDDTPYPAPGRLLRGFGERDAAGIARPGHVYATAPRARLDAPTTGTVRYAGPLLDYGNVIIQEPRPDVLLVFAGLSDVYVSAGQIIDRGAPLGAMGDAPPDGTGGDAPGSTTLYVEVREADRPVDPATWFADE